MPSGDVERHDCSPMRCWQVTSFYVFLHDVIHMHFCQLAWLTYPFKVIDSLVQDIWVSSYKETDQSWPPIFRTTDCNTLTTHSDILSVFLQLQSWHCVGIFCNRAIVCVCYMLIQVLMSLIIVTMKVWTVTVMSSQLVHINNCDLLLGHWPYNFHTHFSAHYE
jgi:hypothetical protein